MMDDVENVSPRALCPPKMSSMSLLTDDLAEDNETDPCLRCSQEPPPPPVHPAGFNSLDISPNIIRPESCTKICKYINTESIFPLYMHFLHPGFYKSCQFFYFVQDFRKYFFFFVCLFNGHKMTGWTFKVTL